MNIFYIDTDPKRAAEAMVDKHVVKMVLETAQLLSTAHRVLDGIKQTKIVNNRKRTFYILSYPFDGTLYQATHINHPSAVWARQSHENYTWLYNHFLALLDEYTFRYGKIHKCAALVGCLKNPPANIPKGIFTQPPPAMVSEFIVNENSLDNYRNYYKLGKVHLHKWTKRQPPEWIL